MTALEANEFYGGDLVAALKEAGFENAFVNQTGGGTATIYVSQSKERTAGKVDEIILGGPGSYQWGDPGKSVFTTDDFYIGEEQYYNCEEDVEKNWEPYTVSTPIGASIADMVNIFAKAAETVNDMVSKKPRP